MEHPEYIVDISDPVKEGTTERVKLTLGYMLTPASFAAMKAEVHGVPGLSMTISPEGTVLTVTAYSKWDHYRGRVLGWLEKNLAETMGAVRVSRIVFALPEQDAVSDVTDTTDPEAVPLRRTWVGWPEECDEQ